MTFDLLRRDTICALATPSGRSAIAVVRVSGPAADEVRARVFRPRRGAQHPFVMTRGDVVDERGVIDDALCVAFPEGRSYTGERAFELSLHGSPVAVRATLAALTAAGCRLAEPGELTLRAHLNGRVSLAEAEAIDDVIDARTDDALRAAQRALGGAVARALEQPRACIVDVLAELEARLDFPDEDLGAARVEQLASSLAQAERALSDLARNAAWAERLRRGARVVLFGPPNAGKSTLFNALVGHERALVHEEPGTTRDVIEAAVEIGGVEVTLIDVAGVRDSADVGSVERAGIERARDEAARADLVLRVRASDEADAWDAASFDGLGVVTKIDRAPAPAGALGVCALTASGLDELRRAIAARLGLDTRSGDVVMLRARHAALVEEAVAALVRARAALCEQAAHELVASELRLGAGALDRVLGRDVSADVLEAVFSRFCIGK